MITDCIKVIEDLLLCGSIRVQVALNKLRKIEVLNWEIYLIFKFILIVRSLTRLKSLQTQEKDWRSFVNLHFLLSLNMVLAIFAIPSIFLAQLFDKLILSKTRFESCMLRGDCLHGLFNLIKVFDFDALLQFIKCSWACTVKEDFK